MKRSPILQPLSREHHTALYAGKASERAANSRDDALVKLTCQRVTGIRDELEPHFRPRYRCRRC